MKLFIALSCALFLHAAPQNDTAPDFKLPDLAKKQVRLADLLKKGPVLLDFWATWCKPCIKAFPELEKLHQKYKKSGLQVIGINEDGPRNLPKIKPFVRSLKVTFPILIDGNSDVMRKLRVQVLPTSILISPDGGIVARHVGYTSQGVRKLEREIQALLKTNTEPPSQ